MTLLNPYRFGVPASYDADATAYFAAMSVQPDATRKGLLNTLIAGLKADGIWALLDWLSIMAAHHEQAGRINAINPAQVATATATPPTFTADRGFTGIPVSSSYLNTGINDDATTNSVQNSSCIFGWLNQTGAVNAPIIGLASGTSHRFVINGTTAYNGRAHAATSVAPAGGPSTGLYSADRASAVGFEIYKDGSQTGTSAIASVARTAFGISFLGTPSATTDTRMAAGGFGASLNATKQAALYSRLNTYLTAVGGA